MNRKYLNYIRFFVQACFTIFSLYIGYRFYLFYEWAIGKGEAYYPRPPGVEAFLPISALLGLKRLLVTGHYDMIHPAGLTILLAVLAVSFLFRKGFCGWICPVGFISNLMERLGNALGTLFPVRRWIGAMVAVPKYALMMFFLYVIFLRMDPKAVEQFIMSPYNISADAKMLKFFLAPSSTTLWVVGGLIVISLFLKNFWCRFLCPYGALLGLLALIGPARIRRDEAECIDCRKCTKVCPAGIEVHNKKTVLDPDCIGCLECVGACPKDQCLTPEFGGRILAPIHFIMAVLLLFLGGWAVAKFLGYWDTVVPLHVFKKFYPMLDAFSHPSY